MIEAADDYGGSLNIINYLEITWNEEVAVVHRSSFQDTYQHAIYLDSQISIEGDLVIVYMCEQKSIPAAY